MATEMPSKGLPNGEQDQDRTLILGSEEKAARANQSRSTRQNTPPADDLAAPEPLASPGLPQENSSADLNQVLASLRGQQKQIQSMEAQLQLLLQTLAEQAPQATRPTTSKSWLALLPPLAAGMVGGGMVVTLLPLLGTRLPIAQAPSELDGSRPEQSSSAQPRPARAQQTLQLRCDQPCWLDVRTANSGKRVFYKLLNGTANLALGSGLDVFSGRADLVKMRVNDGQEQPFLPGRVVGSRVILPEQVFGQSP
jgi:hypothetical protein